MTRIAFSFKIDSSRIRAPAKHDDKVFISVVVRNEAIEGGIQINKSILCVSTLIHHISERFLASLMQKNRDFPKT